MSAHVATPADVWTLNASGFCSVAANWSLGLPVSGGAVVVAPTASGVTLTFDVASFTLGSLTFEGATALLQGGWLTVTKTATLQAATFLGPQRLILGGASQVKGLTLGGGVTLYNRGAVTQSSGWVVIGTSKTSRAVVENLAGATWTDSDDSALTQGAGAVGWFVNRGAFTDSDSVGVTTVSADFQSPGTIAVVAGGQVSFEGLFTSTGTISVAVKGVVFFTGSGATAQLSGAVSGGGTVEYGPQEMATLGALTVTATNQNNLGIVDQTGTMMLDGVQTLENLGQWNLAGDVSILVGAGANAANEIIETSGALLAKTAGTGVSVVGASVNLSGSVNVATGTLEFTGASNALDGVITGAGTFEIGAGVTQLEPPGPNPDLISVAHLRLSGGDTQILGAATDSGAFEGDAGATLTLGAAFAAGGPAFGDLVLDGAADLAGLDVVGAGPSSAPDTLALASTANVSALTLGGNAQVVDRGSVTQSGGDVTLGDALAADAATLTIASGAVWDITDTSAILAGASQGDVITVGSSPSTALFEKTGAGASVVAPLMLNNASNILTSAGVQYAGLEVTAGTLDLHGAVGGTGTDNIVGAGTLAFDNAVQAGQSVLFAGAGGTLELNDPSAFKGGIAGFDTAGGADTLLIAAGTSVFAGASETATAATLAFASKGTTTFTITVNGDYRGGTFAAQTLSGGQIAITY